MEDHKRPHSPSQCEVLKCEGFGKLKRTFTDVEKTLEFDYSSQLQ